MLRIFQILQNVPSSSLFPSISLLLPSRPLSPSPQFCPYSPAIDEKPACQGNLLVLITVSLKFATLEPNHLKKGVKLGFKISANMFKKNIRKNKSDKS